MSVKAKVAGMREKVRANNTLNSAGQAVRNAAEKVGETATDVASTSLKVCGFTAWTVGRLLNPVVRRVRESYDHYRKEQES